MTIILIAQVPSFAQKCKFDKDETDPFSKEQVRITKLTRISGFPAWWIKLEQKGSKYSMTLMMNQIKKINDVIPKGTEIMTKLQDGSVFSLEVPKDVVPNFNVEGSMIVTQWVITIELTEEHLKKLSSSPIELIRTEIANEEYNMAKAKAGGVKSIMNFASCLISN